MITSLGYAEQSSRFLGSQSTNDPFDVTKVIKKATKMFLELVNHMDFENHADYTFYRREDLYRDLRLTYQSPRNARRTLSWRKTQTSPSR